MARAWRRRALLCAALALVAVAAAMLPAIGNRDGNAIQDWLLCGNTENCHGVTGSNTSRATLTVVPPPSLTVYTGQPDISITVRVEGAEQYAGDPIGAFVFSSLYDPTAAGTLTYWVWVVQRDPVGNSPGFNYVRKPAEGATGDTRAEFTWVLQAPPYLGDYRIAFRMHTGQNHGTDPLLDRQVSRDDPVGLLFHVVPEPKVDSTVPIDGAVGVPINSPIQLAFNKEMDRASVGTAFNVSPYVPGDWAWRGAVARYVLAPGAEFTKRTDYTVTLDTSARDLDGINLQSPVRFSFRTGAGSDTVPPEVVSTVASRAPLDAAVRITFSEAMDRGSTESAFSIAPAAQGALSWDGLTLVFTPTRPLQYDTIYRVAIDTTAKDLNDNTLASMLNVTFLTIKDTVPPQVLSAAPADGATGVPLNSNVTLVLSDDVDPATLGAALSTAPAVIWDIVWDGHRAAMVPRHQLEEGTDYTLTVGTALSDVRGNRLATPFVLHFRAAGTSDVTPPYILKVYPAAGGRISPDGSVQVTFSELMDTSSVEAALLVSPAANVTVSWDLTNMSVLFQGLEAGRVYTVNIGPTARDLAGNPIGLPSALRYVAAPSIPARKPFYYVEDWIETWWDLALVALVAAVVAAVAVVQMRIGWRRVVLTAFAWVEERVRTARYMSQARALYYSINRQMPQSHAERYGSKVLWYWYPFYCLGGIAILSFVVCGITGIILSLYYVPSTEGAYASVEHIMQDVSFGYMFRALHHWSANVMIAAVFLHMLRVYFTGAYRNPRELNWIAGVVLLGLTLAYGFSGYLLPWNQLSYWAGTIGVEMTRTVPLLGDWFAKLVFGGLDLGAATLTRMYMFHIFLLPAFTIGLMLVHLVAVYIQGLAEPH
jgi:hypothetical protein